MHNDVPDFFTAVIVLVGGIFLSGLLTFCNTDHLVTAKQWAIAETNCADHEGILRVEVADHNDATDTHSVSAVCNDKVTVVFKFKVE